MPSIDPELTFPGNGAQSCHASDETGLRDAGTDVKTAFAPDPAGCRTDDEQPEASDQTLAETVEPDPVGCRTDEGGEGETENADDGFLSVSAQGDPSDNPPIEHQTTAESIKSRRDFESFLRAAGFSRSAAKSIAANGWQDEADDTETDALDELSDIVGQIKKALSR